jgi:photosystem II stability/assembly factor-like uncharacterized protein
VLSALLVTPSATLAAVCSTAVGINHNPKSVMLSHDGGQTWTTASIVRGDGATDPSGLPDSDLFGLDAAPSGALYISTTMAMARSSDGGRSWAPLDIVGPQHSLPGNAEAGAQFSFVGAHDGWLLLESEALLRTVDGTHWTVLSSVPRGG